MTYSENEYYPVRRFRLTLVSLFVLIIMLALIGLLSHRTTSIDHPVWKSSPYGDPRDTGAVKAGH